jgi:hypothetical protein
MTYDDIMRAEQKRAAKVSAKGAKRGRRSKGSNAGNGKRLPEDELETSKREIAALGLEDYCSVLQFGHDDVF